MWHIPLEIEMKLRMGEGLTGERILSDPEVENLMRGTPRVIQMHSWYYDTAASELSGRRWSLRLREEDGLPVATMKTSGVDTGGSLFSRYEYSVIAPTIGEAIPLLIADGAPAELAELTAGELIERCEIVFTRTSAILELQEGVIVNLCVDVGDIRADGKSEPFGELEIELLFGRAEDVAPLYEVLQSRYPLEREQLTKYERALRLIRSRPK